MTHRIYTSPSNVTETSFPNILANQKKNLETKINKKRFENGGIPETATQRTTNKTHIKSIKKGLSTEGVQEITTNKIALKIKYTSDCLYTGKYRK